MSRRRRLVLAALLAPWAVAAWALPLATGPSAGVVVVGLLWVASLAATVAIRRRTSGGSSPGPVASDPGALARDRF